MAGLKLACRMIVLFGASLGWTLQPSIAFGQGCQPVEVAKLVAGDASANDAFGYAVAIEGDTAAVGAYRDQLDNGLGGNGSVTVYHFDGQDWVEQAVLTPNDVSFGFGYSLALDGNVLVVGARYDGDHGSNKGAAYIFQFNGAQWNQQAKIVASDGMRDDEFGFSVAIDGDVIVVGAPQNSLTGPGWAYVFRRVGSAWVQEAKLTASDGMPRDDFGQSVAVSNSTILVGAWNVGNTGQSFPDGFGAVYVYRFANSQWIEQDKLFSPDPLPGELDRFGKAVALEGDLALIGTEPITTQNTTAPSGSAYLIKDVPGLGWVNQAKLLGHDTSPGDRFGAAVSLDGSIALVGAWGQWSIDDPCSENPPLPGVCNVGAAYVFVHQLDDTWLEQAKLVSSDAAEGDLVGWAVALGGQRAFVGAWRDDDAGADSGSAYVFELACHVPCRADLTGDGNANTQDFIVFLNAWTTGDPLADWNSDGVINTSDFTAYLNDWAAGC